MGMPYEIKPMGGLVVPGNGSAVFEVKLPSRSVIYKIVCQQVGGGAGAAFDLEFFSSADAAASLSDSDEDGDTGKLPPELYRVTPRLSGVDGLFSYFNENGSGYPFLAAPPAGRSVGHAAHVRISNHSPGEKVFALAVGVYGQDPG